MLRGKNRDRENTRYFGLIILVCKMLEQNNILDLYIE